MLLRDQKGYLLDNHAGDGGDSANRAGLSELFGLAAEPLADYEIGLTGKLVRHPSQFPWNNPKNFTRDQLIPFAAGLWQSHQTALARRIFWSRARRLFFSQSTERDIPGSKKFPWPHQFINDGGQLETRRFDFADPLMPDAIWHLILCARLKPLYWFGLIGAPWLFLSVVGHCLLSKSDDEGQIIAQAVVGGRGFIKLYKKLKPDWQDSLERYWCGWRNMPEMAQAIKTKF
ncbi:MAG: hypothetical protein H7326_06820 [Bdellovibrionaceae bacterium]|nr:hypothetical protein [Pseudobdellovibrionaceae bacterium]